MVNGLPCLYWFTFEYDPSANTSIIVCILAPIQSNPCSHRCLPDYSTAQLAYIAYSDLPLAALVVYTDLLLLLAS